MALDDEKRLEHLRTYAWSWFSFHADQRTKMFNFFVASSAFLVAGFASAASNHLWSVAIAIGILGFLNGILFWRLDARNEELVNYAKVALHKFEQAVFIERWPAAQPATAGEGPVPSALLQNPLGDGISLADQAKDESASPPGKPLSLPQRVWRGKHGTMLPMIEIMLSVVFALGTVFASYHSTDQAKPGMEDILTKLTEVVEKTNRANEQQEQSRQQQAQALQQQDQALKQLVANSQAHDDELAKAVSEVAAALRRKK